LLDDTIELELLIDEEVAIHLRESKLAAEHELIFIRQRTEFIQGAR
jgi:hypothetical protein